ncbi:MAG: single-stranded DNA-binding protein [Lapillicoccus sp.]
MTTTQASPADPATNEVRLVGRVSGAPEAREMPSGDEVVQFRVVVRRPPARARPATETPRTQVDTIDVACWSPSTRRLARRLAAGDVVEVEGALRRRFYRAGAVAVSRYEVEAVTVRRQR